MHEGPPQVQMEHVWEVPAVQASLKLREESLSNPVFWNQNLGPL